MDELRQPMKGSIVSVQNSNNRYGDTPEYPTTAAMDEVIESMQDKDTRLVAREPKPGLYSPSDVGSDTGQP